MPNHRFTYITRKLGDDEYAFHKFKQRFKVGADQLPTEELELDLEGNTTYERSSEEVFLVKRGVCNCSGYQKREQETRGGGTCKHIDMARKLEAEEGQALTNIGARAALAPLLKVNQGLALDDPAFVLDERGNVLSAKLTHQSPQLRDIRLTVGGMKVTIRRRG